MHRSPTICFADQISNNSDNGSIEAMYASEWLNIYLHVLTLTSKKGRGGGGIEMQTEERNNHQLNVYSSWYPQS